MWVVMVRMRGEGSERACVCMCAEAHVNELCSSVYVLVC